MLVTEAYLGSLFFQTFFYGISAATFIECLRVMVGNAATYQSSAGVRRSLLLIATLMFIIATVSSIRLFRHVLVAFVYVANKPSETVKVLLDAGDPMAITFAISYTIQALLGDSVLVFRTWAVYDYSWIKVSAPIIILLADLGIGCRIISLELTVDQHGRVNDKRFLPFITSYIVLTLVCNVLCTVMITARIWKVTRKAAKLRLHENKQSRWGYLHTAARILLESGLLYAASTAVQLGVAISGNNAIYPVADCMVPIIAICFHLIIVRSNWQRSSESSRSANVLDESDDSSLARAVSLRVRHLSRPPVGEAPNSDVELGKHGKGDLVLPEDPVWFHAEHQYKDDSVPATINSRESREALSAV